MYTYYLVFCQTFLTAILWFSKPKLEKLGPANDVLLLVILDVRGVIIFCVYQNIRFDRISEVRSLI